MRAKDLCKRHWNYRILCFPADNWLAGAVPSQKKKAEVLFGASVFCLINKEHTATKTIFSQKTG
jgi:hypothetical protein